MQDEQRKYRRVNTHLETIYFTEAKTDAGYERLYFPGLIVDKSKSGLGIKVNNEHNINDRIWIEGHGVSSDPQLACIRWINALSGDADKFRIGVEILAVD